MKLKNIFPLIVAAALQVLPMMRNALPELQAMAPSSWAVILRLTTGAIALFGFDAISSASSIAISPVNATVGVPYVGTITYSGSHAGEVSSMTITNLCMTSARALVPGLTTTYSSVNKANVSGTPTTAGTFSFTIRVYDGGCGAGDSDPRSTSLVVGPPPNTNVAPTMAASPQSVTAQVGSDVLLSAGASGNPVPRYYWYLGIPSPSTLVATNSSLTLTNVQLTNAGLYTVIASNVAGVTPNSAGQAYLSICKTVGSNILALNYTNYAIVSNAITMTSYITNAPSGSNTYKWQYNYVDIPNNYGVYNTTNYNFPLSANTVTAVKSGIYSVVFNGIVGSTTVVDQQAYNSYWAFGVPPVINTSPQSTNVLAGTNITLSASATVQQNPYGTNLTLGFLWYQNNTNLLAVQANPGTNQSANLNLASVNATNSGTYTVVVTNFWGSVTSSPAIVIVTSPPGISSQPSSRTVLAGQTVNFSVTATGTDPLSYQWRKHGSDLSNGGVYSGATNSILTLTGVQAANADDYSVAITNTAGWTNSSTATLTVVSPPSVSLTVNGAGSWQLNAATVTGLTYKVEAAASLTPPVVWGPVATNVVPPSGLIVFTNATGNPEGYFRLMFP